ncbi:hypothetical protein CPG37_08890 [Malaciobacter canalis]|uniref:Uncharacterized protein n=1 Tax=Malaciobacter canalis TaxID=1912871 RepID=A0ABX4LTT7_9BACT|nr:hypothetical protein [Malaciobacter canalis]PHO09606.1 hypothetical protein CPG37_08890 [Malaciobacter canalis]QEE31675.1 hypothetical protein ACAN_0139 [Malaciobacter canalis]
MTQENPEENWSINLCNDIILMVDTDEFNYSSNMISRLFRDHRDSIISYNRQEKNPDRFFSNYTHEEKIALKIFEDLLKESNRLMNIDLTNKQDKVFLEKYFKKISFSLNNVLPAQFHNYSLPLHSTPTLRNINSYNKKIIRTNEKNIEDLFPVAKQRKLIDLEQNSLYQKNLDRKNQIIQKHSKTFNKLEKQDLIIWKDQNNKLFYRPKAFEKVQKISKTEIEDITKSLDTKVYDTTDDVQVVDANFIIISRLPIVRKDVFNPFTNNEFIFLSNNLHDRNKFEYTKLLEKRLSPAYIDPLEHEINDIKQKLHYTNLPLLQDIYNNQLREKQNRLNFIKDSLVTNENSFIEQFLRLLFQNEEKFYFFITWLSRFFWVLEKSNIALVLIGDDETTDIIMNFIVKPIFIKKKKYLSTITNSTLDKEIENEKLLEDKIFYHINNLNTKTDTKRVSKLIRMIIKPNSITPSEAWDNDEQYIYGNLLVTSSKESPYPYLKDVLSNCSVFRVKDIESILNKLDMDYSDFEESMTDDIDNFTNKLVQYGQDNYSLTVLDTDEKRHLCSMKNGLLITPKIDSKINHFIENILNININAFQSIQRYDKDIYNELIHNFKEEMIAQPMLSRYFNIIHQEELIPDNNEFIKILQGKVKMYKETPTDKSKYNGKKRYKIFRN